MTASALYNTFCIKDTAMAGEGFMIYQVAADSLSVA